MKLTIKNTYSIGWSVCAWCKTAMKRVWLSRTFETHGICKCCGKDFLK